MVYSLEDLFRLYVRFHSYQTHFGTEAQVNSEITYWRGTVNLLGPFLAFSFLHLLRTFNSLLDFQVEFPGEVLDVSCGVDHMAAILKCS